jgi:transcriptional regulator with XRE-family HTH domain
MIRAPWQKPGKTFDAGRLQVRMLLQYCNYLHRTVAMANCKRGIIAKLKFMPKGMFDAEGFFHALDEVRLKRKLTWKDVAKESDVSASTLTRMAQHRRPDVDSLAALVRWSNLSADDFVMDSEDSEKELPSPVASIAAQFRRDKNLPPAAKKAIEATLKAMYEHFAHRED